MDIDYCRFDINSLIDFATVAMYVLFRFRLNNRNVCPRGATDSASASGAGNPGSIPGGGIIISDYQKRVFL